MSIQNIQNGVTTGGEAPVVFKPEDNSGMYLQYIQQLEAERQNALNDNYKLVKDLDLSKVDPRDRPFIQAKYDDFKQNAMSQPISNKKGEMMAWRNGMLDKYKDVQNAITDAISRRKDLVDGFTRDHETLSTNGLKQYNEALNKSIFDENGNPVEYKYDSFERKPEQVFDADSVLQNLIKRNTTEGQQLASSHRGRDGKTVSVSANVLNGKALNNSVQDEMNYNPQFKHAIEERFKKYQELNPDDKTTTMGGFISDYVKHHMPAMSERDLHLAKDIHPGDGLYAYNYATKDPAYYEQHVNINTANKEQAAKDARQNLISNTLTGAATALKSGDSRSLEDASQQLTNLLKGRQIGNKGPLQNIVLGKDEDGSYIQNLYMTPDYKIARDQKTYINDNPNWHSQYFAMYNNGFKNKPEKMVPQEYYNSTIAPTIHSILNQKQDVQSYNPLFPGQQGVIDVTKNPGAQANRIDQPKHKGVIHSALKAIFKMK